MRPRIVAGNWKMNGDRAFAATLVGDLAGATLPDGVEAIVMPPFPYIAALATEWAGKGVAFGAQDVSEHEKGAYTGEVSAGMLKDIGATHVLVGHSERRQYHGEDSALVARKFAAARAAGLVPVLCVGETREEREGGKMQAVIAAQLDPVFEACGPQALEGAVVAYEPVWAIGTGRSASPDDAAEATDAIVADLLDRWGSGATETRVLYGGSVNPGNIGAFMAKRSINGALVGGSSLDPDEYAAVIRYWI